MKKVILLISIISTLAVHNTFAQKDPKAKLVLDAISNKYKSIGGYKVLFIYTLSNQSAGVTDRVSGEVAIKDDKYLLKVKGQEIYCNGKTLWTFIKDDNEVTISDYEPEPNEVTPSSIYTLYQNGFKYAFIGEVTEGGVVYETVEISPEKVDAQYYKIKIKSNKQTKSLKTWEIYEKNGNVYLYQVTELRQLEFPSQSSIDSYFTFDKTKYPNVEVSDLR